MKNLVFVSNGYYFYIITEGSEYVNIAFSKTDCKNPTRFWLAEDKEDEGFYFKNTGRVPHPILTGATEVINSNRDLILAKWIDLGKEVRYAL